MTNWDLYFQKQVGDTEMKRLIEEEMKRLIEEEIKILRIEQAVPGICTRSNPYTCPMEPHTHPREVDPLVAAARRGFAGHSREQAAPEPHGQGCYYDDAQKLARALTTSEGALADAHAAIREAHRMFYEHDYAAHADRAAWLALPAVVAAREEKP